MLAVANLDGAEFASVEALVDTGATYTMLGEDLLASLGIQPTGREEFALGDGSLIEYNLGHTRLRLEGKERVATVIFGPAGASHLIGAVTLQSFRLIADSVNERLITMQRIHARSF